MRLPVDSRPVLWSVTRASRNIPATMVKIGQELVAGPLSVVIGRVPAGRTRTMDIIPLDSFTGAHVPA